MLNIKLININSIIKSRLEFIFILKYSHISHIFIILKIIVKMATETAWLAIHLVLSFI